MATTMMRPTAIFEGDFYKLLFEKVFIMIVKIYLNGEFIEVT